MTNKKKHVERAEKAKETEPYLHKTNSNMWKTTQCATFAEQSSINECNKHRNMLTLAYKSMFLSSLNQHNTTFRINIMYHESGRPGGRDLWDCEGRIRRGTAPKLVGSGQRGDRKGISPSRVRTWKRWWICPSNP